MEPDCPEPGKPEGRRGGRWAWAALGVENRTGAWSRGPPHPGPGVSAWARLWVA